MDPDHITRELKLQPHLCNRVGTPRTAPNGKSLPGNYRDSRWSYSVTYTIHGQWFVEKLNFFVEELEGHKALLNEIRASGGRTNLIAAFLGDGHFGDSVDAELLARMAALSIDFGIEVYTVPQR